MQRAIQAETRPPESPPSAVEEESTEPDLPATELLELLGDEYTHAVLGAVLERPRTGAELVEATDVSKATVYRRLDRLQEAGIVDARLKLDTDGHHCKQFYPTAASVRVGLDADGFAASIESADQRGDGFRASDD